MKPLYEGVRIRMRSKIKGIMNEHFAKMPGNYLFSEIARRVELCVKEHPDWHLIRLGIGDVTKPLCAAVVSAMHQAVDEMGQEATFRGYGPEQGYAFLREAVAVHDYESRKADIHPDEIFISDGSKCDVANITDLFHHRITVSVLDPVYPVYVDTNVMDGRAGSYDPASLRWSKIVYMPCTDKTGFLPRIPKAEEAAPDLIYLCFPNNPMGTAIGYNDLARWVEYANRHGSIILYDSAYEAYIREDLPHSIFEIPGAKQCAIEFRSFSKTAGFTGVRCAYTVVPKSLMRDNMSVHAMWNRRQSTKFNGVSYVTQRAAEAVYSKEGKEQIRDQVNYYMNNAAIIRDGLTQTGFQITGGRNAPYIWLKTPVGMSSWDFFSDLLEKTQIVGTPGSGFGPSGEGYFRLTAFGTAEKTAEAMARIREIY
jgi:LL-diaminopimelate aminotransferase